MYHKGDKIIYRKRKISSSPGPRATMIRPNARGEFYQYCVDKCRRVLKVEGKKVIAVTRTGKRRVIASDAPDLRPATLLDRLRYRQKFDFAVPSTEDS